MAERTSPLPRARVPLSLCVHCGRPVFTLRPVDSGERLYCSLACRYDEESLEDIAKDIDSWAADMRGEEADDDL